MSNKRIQQIVKKIDSNIQRVEDAKMFCMFANDYILLDFYNVMSKLYNHVKPIQVYYRNNNSFLYDKEDSPFSILELESNNNYYSKEDSWEKDFI